METCVALSKLSDEALVREAMRLVRADRRTAIALVRVLMEVDERQLYLHEGCGSIFVWCTKVLHIDEGPAYNRITVARAAARFPAVLAALDSGVLGLTAVRRLAPYLTDSNQADVLARAAGRTTRQLDLLIAEIAPRRSVPATIRRLPGTDQRPLAEPSSAPPLPAESAPPPAALADPSAASAGHPATSGAAASFNARSRASAVPLSPTRFKLQMTISAETHATLRRAQDLLRHAVPNGDLVDIVDRALTVLVQHLERQRFAATDSPRASGTPSTSSRHIPATVRRAVWLRDGGQCAYVGRLGRCGERAWLEFHHLTPYAIGGPASVENVALRCRAHNAFEASQFFGQTVMSRVRARAAAERGRGGVGVRADARASGGSTTAPAGSQPPGATLPGSLPPSPPGSASGSRSEAGRGAGGPPGPSG